MRSNVSWPLMQSNISKLSLKAVKKHISGKNPILTNSKNVRIFERNWSEWLGVKYSTMLNSGSSANFITISVIKQLFKEFYIFVPSLTWSSDIASVVFQNIKPILVDICLKTLAFSTSDVMNKVYNIRAVSGLKPTIILFMTHILGLKGFTTNFLHELRQVPNLYIVEDVCESHGAFHKNKLLGSFGWVSNFSFYYAHHLSTIEGGMVCTNDRRVYELTRMFRSHGMLRESQSDYIKNRYHSIFKNLNSDFIFTVPGFNMRSSEINGILGYEQLPYLNCKNIQRSKNFILFLKQLDNTLFFTQFITKGNSNYALILVLKGGSLKFRDKVEAVLNREGVEYRRGLSGGGNQSLQPYVLSSLGLNKRYRVTEYVHFFGYYIGNYPELKPSKISLLCKKLNNSCCSKTQ
ncbi:MAG: DegT/DnrJ/EryC1/StrS family aminotransferase [Candidatus Organicella extenuata]|uniref:DegT/DnrJ/EryC1/StrS family aminotransferase n=1 Tax=Candidatus Organicella extenuata TaxID=2841811 RepID=A0AA51BKB4_9BACT|nr:MAG: DegT/DnrJ/EryC1/StrS family aminotransferase [Candidatus Organicella extenuata]